MTRQIKFRAYDKENDTWYKPVNPVDSSLGNWMMTNDGRTYVKGEYKDLILMQSTGLLDKNGKEIYESDYLGDWCVFWGSGKYILQNISSGDIIDCNEENTSDKKITGNRYETPREHSAMASDL